MEKESELITVTQAARYLIYHDCSKLTLIVATGVAVEKAAGVQRRTGREHCSNVGKVEQPELIRSILPNYSSNRAQRSRKSHY